MYPAPKLLHYCCAFVAAAVITTTGDAQETRQHLYVESTPFNRVMVLDNRIDTIKVYTAHSGKYPPESLKWQNVAYEMEQHITKTLSTVPMGNTTLLVNIEQLRVSNRWGGYIMFLAGVFSQTENGRYRKIITINAHYAMDKDIDDVLKPLAIDLVDAATVYTDPAYS